MYASILAGGSGTRLWPLSTKQRPKQFLQLTSERTMLQETVDRLTPLVPLDQLYIVTFADYAGSVAEQLPGLPRANIVGEPGGRGTAASIGLAAALIAARDRHAVMGSFHADHAIANAPAFREALTFAEEVARQGFLVTLGIHPATPETGYGYIRYGAPVSHTDGLTAHTVEAFIEKPPRETAEGYVRAGNYVWNAGIFVWRVDRILEEITRHVPRVGAMLEQIAAAAQQSGGRITAEVDAAIRRAWPDATFNETIDKGVLEKTDRIAVIPVEIGWNDIGSWDQVAALHEPDEQGNAMVGVAAERQYEVSSHDNLVYSTTGRTVALAGVSGLVVVDTGEALLICTKAQAQLVKKITDEMQRRT
ncbi:MAG TPA: sugar phosphate nucleotidyltransferase [Ktedonobacterales bacterium]|jgi:mannose-1-phosphate guanylyltransferase